MPHLEEANRGRFETRYLHTYLNRETVELARDCSCVSVFITDDASSEVLKKLHALGVSFLALRSAGYNHVDLECAAHLGIRAANVPEYSPYSVAEHTVALMLALNRKLVRAHARVRELNFSLDGLTGFDMHGKTVGVIGTGTIGAVVVRILRGFGCQVLGYDISPNQDLIEHHQVAYTDIDTLCRSCDIITLHVPLTSHTHYLIDAERISLMKRGVMLINTSRGGLVHTKAVIDALKTGKIGYLGLDVYEEERGLFFEDHSDQVLQDDVIARLMTFNNVMITSHQAFLTDTALTNIAETTFDNIEAWANGERSSCELWS